MEQGQSGSPGPGTGTEVEPVAVACALADTAFVQRADEVIREFSRGLDRVEELSDGFALRFPGSKEWIDRLVDFVTYERDCCPFFAFELTFEPQGGPVWLRLRGDGVKEFLEVADALVNG